MNVSTPKALVVVDELYAVMEEFTRPTQQELSKISLKTLVDKFGFLKAVCSTAKLLEDSFKENLKERLGDGPFEGKLFRVTKSTYDKASFNEEACFEELKKFLKKKGVRYTEQELNNLVGRFYRVSTVVSLRCGSRKGV